MILLHIFLLVFFCHSLTSDKCTQHNTDSFGANFSNAFTCYVSSFISLLCVGFFMKKISRIKFSFSVVYRFFSCMASSNRD